MNEIGEGQEVGRWISHQATGIMMDLSGSEAFHCSTKAQLFATAEIVELALAAYNLGLAQGRTEAIG